MNFTPIPKFVSNDSNVIVVHNGNLKQAIKQWRARINNYKGLRILRKRSEHPAPGDRKRWKRKRVEQNRIRRQRRVMV